LTLLYASLEELGYDPNIWRVRDTTLKVNVNKEHPIKFAYKVGEHYYKTLFAIEERWSMCVTGRATRVWLVTEIPGLGNLRPIDRKAKRVLKDCWLDVGMPSEREIQHQIFADLDGVAAILAPSETPVDTQATNTPPERPSQGLPTLAPLSPTVFDETARQNIFECFRSIEKQDKGNGLTELQKIMESLRDYKRHFLTIEHEFAGVQSKPVPAKCFRVTNVFTVGSTNEAVPDSVYSTRRTGHSEGGPRPEDASPGVIERAFTPKQRHFTVVKEVCKTLHNLKDLSLATSTISDCLQGTFHRSSESAELTLDVPQLPCSYCLLAEFIATSAAGTSYTTMAEGF
jgi:hypothetical protein